MPKTVKVRKNPQRDELVQDMMYHVIDAIITQWGLHSAGIRRCANEADVSPSTLYNWLNGRVKRPQYLTLAKVLRASGYRITVSPASQQRTKLRRVK